MLRLKKKNDLCGQEAWKHSNTQNFQKKMYHISRIFILSGLIHKRYGRGNIPNQEISIILITYNMSLELIVKKIC